MLETEYFNVNRDILIGFDKQTYSACKSFWNADEFKA